MLLAREYQVEISKDNKNFEKLITSKCKTFRTNVTTIETINLAKYLQDNAEKTVYLRFSDPTPEDEFGTTIVNIFVKYKADGQAPTAEEMIPYYDNVEPAYQGILFAANTSYEKEYLMEEQGAGTLSFFGDNIKVLNEDAYAIYKFDLANNTYTANLVFRAFKQYKFSVSTDNEYYIDVASNPDMFAYEDGRIAAFQEADISDFLYDNPSKVLYIKVEDYTPYDKGGTHLYAFGIEYTTKGENIPDPSIPEESEPNLDDTENAENAETGVTVPYVVFFISIFAFGTSLLCLLLKRGSRLSWRGKRV